MTSSDRNILFDLLAGSSAVLAFLFPIHINKIYHGYYGLSFEDGRPLSYLLISWLLIVGLWLWRFNGLNRLVQWWLCMSLLIGLSIPYGPMLASDWGVGRTVVLFVLLLSIGVIFSYMTSLQIWGGLRRVIAVVPWLVVVAPLLAAHLIAKPYVWLDAPPLKIQRK